VEFLVAIVGGTITECVEKHGGCEYSIGIILVDHRRYTLAQSAAGQVAVERLREAVTFGVNVEMLQMACCYRNHGVHDVGILFGEVQCAVAVDFSMFQALPAVSGRLDEVIDKK
jgi:hypothetical protein